MSDLQTIYVSWHETVKQWSDDGYLPQAWPCVFERRRDGAQKYHHDDKFRALEAENESLKAECDTLARENAKYEERHKAWKAAVYLVDPVPSMRAVRDTEYGDSPLPVPQVKNIVDLLDKIQELASANEKNSGWQHISTAPLDGTYVVVALAGDDGRMRWACSAAYGKKRGDKRPGWFDGTGERLLPPSHWILFPVLLPRGGSTTVPATDRKDDKDE